MHVVSVTAGLYTIIAANVKVELHMVTLLKWDFIIPTSLMTKVCDWYCIWVNMIYSYSRDGINKSSFSSNHKAYLTEKDEFCIHLYD